ncbi:MAG: hypothetical protein HQL95_03905 [Magnetococcales bacterium]|nr:hypothetical protein [Magnetococcales bacterium]
MNRPNLLLPWLLGLLLALSLPAEGFCLDNNKLDDAFDRFEKHLDDFIVSLTRREWFEADKSATALMQMGNELLKIGQHENNSTWEYYASNLVHHGQELQTACWKQDSREAIYLISILINHLGEIQSAAPVWLLSHIDRKIHELQQGIATHDRKRTRDAAEVIHDSAHKIILSASTSRQHYRHTRWLTNLLEFNRLGDQLVGDDMGNDWATQEDHLKRIQSIFATWKDGFHPSALLQGKP